ncbi:MAG: hypothetical protein ACFCUO_07640 [Rhodospirillales bacterium]
MSIASLAATAVAARDAATLQAMNVAMLRQQHAAQQSIVRMLAEAVTPPARVAPGRLDVTA